MNREQMLLKPESILKFLPKEIELKQRLIFDSIRFTIEMIECSFFELNMNLEKLALRRTKRNLPQIFLYAWSIIDNVKRFIALNKKLPSKDEHSYLNSLRKVVEFRNTFQHLDERIDEVLFLQQAPFYGALVWEYKNQATNGVEIFIALSGIRYSKTHEFKVTEYKNLEHPINNIRLESVNKKNKIIINLNELYRALFSVIEFLEKDLKNQLSSMNLNSFDWKDHRDNLLIIKNEKKN